MATLMHLHLSTHPERVARQFGVSAEYVRRQWRNLHLHEMAPLADALAQIDVPMPRPLKADGDGR